MKGAQSLALAVVLVLGVMLGGHAQRGIETAAQAATGTRGSRAGAAPTGIQLASRLDVRTVLAAGGEGSCQSDADCAPGEACIGESPVLPGDCYEACQSAADCSDDGYVCTDAVCVGPVPSEGVSVCGHDYSESNCGEFRATHLVTVQLGTGDDNARSLGIHGECFDETLGPTVPSEECVFQLEAVQYRRDRFSGSTKFDAVCIDLDPNDSVPTCSPMERESLAFGVGPSVGPHIAGDAGVAAGVAGFAEAGFDVQVGFSVPITVHRRFRYPMWRRFTGRVGGNILIDSGIGSVVARESVVFAHNGFDGQVTFFVTKPEGMKLTVGYKRLTGDPVCTPGPCPPPFANALDATSGLLGPAGTVAGEDEFESDFDIQEVIEVLDNETQAIDDIIDELRERIQGKIADSFAMVNEYLGSTGRSASSGQRNVIIDKMMELLRGRIQENLQEIRDIARDMVGCPDN